ncbi:hypothetical protein ACFQ8C_09860 [Streptomyces sp. NPDC056503]|uniref:hypothetical protein n=1 Tax=Streptomyces sp. NPDC056503 TaxID=3345842 RepID=UPI00368A8893
MSFEDPDRRAPGRRRHASARRGRGAVWLVAAGGAAVLGLGAVALTGGGTKRPADREGGGGLPALIQAVPTESGTAPTPAPSRSASRPAAPGRSTAPGAVASRPPTTAPSEPAAPVTPEETAPAAVPTDSGGTATGKPGRGRGNGKGPR